MGVQALVGACAGFLAALPPVKKVWVDCAKDRRHPFMRKNFPTVERAPGVEKCKIQVGTQSQRVQDNPARLRPRGAAWVCKEVPQQEKTQTAKAAGWPQEAHSGYRCPPGVLVANFPEEARQGHKPTQGGQEWPRRQAERGGKFTLENPGNRR